VSAGQSAVATAPVAADAVAAGPVARAVRHTVGVCLALAPVGFVLGVTIRESVISGLTGWVGGPLLASGAAHFAFLAVLDRGDGALVAVTTAVAVSSRTVLYSAALSTRFRSQPRWFRWLAPYFLVDQLFAMVEEEHDRNPGATHFRLYYLTIGVMLVTTWSTVIAAGILLGPIVPADVRVELLVVVLVVAMLRPALAVSTGWIAAATAALVAAAGGWLPTGSGLLVGALVGMAAAARWERQR
jgi:predicted branched-subunit amino acid permease